MNSDRLVHVDFRPSSFVPQMYLSCTCAVVCANDPRWIVYANGREHMTIWLK